MSDNKKECDHGCKNFLFALSRDCEVHINKYSSEKDLQEKETHETPIFRYCKKGDISKVKKLLELDVKVRIQNKWGDTPLIITARSAFTRKVILPTEDSFPRNTYIHYDKSKDYIYILRLLLEHDEKFLKEALKNTAENVRESMSHKEISKEKVEHAVTQAQRELRKNWKPYIDIPNHMGYTALITACNHDCNCVEFLLENKADISAQTEYGYTALMKAVLKKDTRNVKLLLVYKADVLQKNNSDETALDLAYQQHNDVMVALLKSV